MKTCFRGIGLALLFACLVLACNRDVVATPVPVQPITGLPSGTDGLPWWSDSVFYEIFVRSFYDSNGDGIGDFQGIIQKLDYLNDGNPSTTNDLGVTGIWLMPVNPSPSYHGYDVTDYYAVNPQYGTLDDFKQLVAEAHRRGIRVIIDMVLNHTSTDHPLFQASEDPNSPYRDWFIWSATDPGYVGPWGQQVWYQSFDGGGYYYAIFWQGMPDLNYANPAVTDQMDDVARYWIQDVGVDGFRLDAAKHLVEQGQTQENSDLTHAWWKDFHNLVKGWNPQGMIIGEIWSSNYAVAAYTKGDELDMAFNFDLANAILLGVSDRRASRILDALKISGQLYPQNQYGSFLTNHDMNRVMNQLSRDVAKAKTASTILLTVPGTPFIYYGEEIGMVGAKPDELIRTPMQWSSGGNAGFSSTSPWESINTDYMDVNVAAQASNPNSLFSHYQTLIGLRNQHAALRVGTYYEVQCSLPDVLAFLRVSRSETVLVVVNLGKEPVKDYNLSMASGPLSGSYNVAWLLGEGKLSTPKVNAQGGFGKYRPVSEIPADGAIILQLQPKK